MKNKQSHEQQWFNALLPNKAISIWKQSPKRKQDGMREAYTDSDCNCKMGWEAGRKKIFNQEKKTRHEVLRELDFWLIIIKTSKSHTKYGFRIQKHKFISWHS